MPSASSANILLYALQFVHAGFHVRAHSSLGRTEQPFQHRPQSSLGVTMAVFADPCKINPPFSPKKACSFFSDSSDLLMKLGVAISAAFREEMWQGKQTTWKWEGFSHKKPCSWGQQDRETSQGQGWTPHGALQGQAVSLGQAWALGFYWAQECCSRISNYFFFWIF